MPIPFADNEYDAVVSQAMLVLIKEQKKVITEAVRVTKKGGYPTQTVRVKSWRRREYPTLYDMPQKASAIVSP